MIETKTCHKASKVAIKNINESDFDVKYPKGDYYREITSLNIISADPGFFNAITKSGWENFYQINEHGLNLNVYLNNK